MGKQLAQLLQSFDKTGGVERLMDYIFYQGTAINGFDGISHYLRAGFITNTCSVYTVEPAAGCSSNFGETRVLGKKDGSKSDLGAQLADTPQGGTGRGRARRHQPVRDAAPAGRPEDPQAARGRHSGTRAAVSRKVSPAFGQQDGTDAALDYLLGGDE